MSIQLNIKDEDLVRRTKELARRRRQPVTAYLRALIDSDRQAQEVEREALLAKVNAISAEFVANLPPEWKGKTSKEIMDSIYDDDEPDGFAR